MRLPLLLPVCALSLLNAQSTDPNRSGFPHDMIWFNVPKTLEPGVQHKGYHSVAMDRQIGYNIYLPPGYETGSQRYPVVDWLHGRNNTEISDSYPVHYLADGIAAGMLPPMILVYASGGSQTNYCDSYDGKYRAETTVIKELIPLIDKSYRTIAIPRRPVAAGDVDGRLRSDAPGFEISRSFQFRGRIRGRYRSLEATDAPHPSYAEMFNNDKEIYRENHPEYPGARRNAAKILRKGWPSRSMSGPRIRDWPGIAICMCFSTS